MQWVALSLRTASSEKVKFSTSSKKYNRRRCYLTLPNFQGGAPRSRLTTIKFIRSQISITTTKKLHVE